MSETKEPGRVWSSFGFAIGVGASIAANIADSYVAPAGAPDGWAPPPGAGIGAAFWPIALVISIEVISRVNWPNRWYWFVIRYIGLTLVAALAAVISYRHLAGLMHFWGEDGLTAAIGPLVVDGLMVICSGALLAIGHNLRQRDVPAVKTEPVPAAAEPVEPKRRTRNARGEQTHEAVKKAAVKTRRRDPQAPVAKIAAAAGVSESTARRELNLINGVQLTPQTPAEATA